MQLLNHRSEFENIVSTLKVPDNFGSSINNLKWFVENGHRSNSLRNGFEDAKNIALIEPSAVYIGTTGIKFDDFHDIFGAVSKS